MESLPPRKYRKMTEPNERPKLKAHFSRHFKHLSVLFCHHSSKSAFSRQLALCSPAAKVLHHANEGPCRLGGTALIVTRRRAEAVVVAAVHNVENKWLSFGSSAAKAKEASGECSE
jgi:hypothetical protein